MKIYIAGPMTGVPEHNFPAFDRAKVLLLKDGYEVVSPADIDRAMGFEGLGTTGAPEETKTMLREMFERDIIALFDCDAIYLLKGWMNSVGATAEHAVARRLGLIEYEQD